MTVLINASAVMGNRLFHAFAQAALLFSLSRSLSITAFGIFLYVLLALGVAQTLLEWGFPTLVLRQSGEHAGHGFRDLRHGCRFVWTGGPVLVSGAILIISLLSPGGLLSNSHVVGLTVYTILRALSGIHTGFIYGVERPRVEMTALGLESTILVGVAILGLMLPIGALSFAIGMCVAAASGLALRHRAVAGMHPKPAPAPEVHRATVRALPYLIFNLAVTGYLRVDALVIVAFVSSADLAWYQACVRILMFSLFVPESIAVSAMPGLARCLGSKPERHVAVGGHVMLFFAAGTLLMAIVMVFADSMLSLLYGPPYLLATPTLRLLAVSIVPRSIAILAGTLLTASGCQTRRTFALVVVACLSIPFATLLIDNAGILGAALSRIVGDSLLAVAYGLVFLRTRRGTAVGSVGGVAPSAKQFGSVS